mmetsp:Transcript_32837/g.77036  ORF Transcript_32837/g.77036 Transcript_32837/m.77036 type:complete len:207 (+) Transcript_32837:397-1017(+)
MRNRSKNAASTACSVCLASSRTISRIFSAAVVSSPPSSSSSPSRRASGVVGRTPSWSSSLDTADQRRLRCISTYRSTSSRASLFSVDSVGRTSSKSMRLSTENTLVLTLHLVRNSNRSSLPSSFSNTGLSPSPSSCRRRVCAALSSTLRQMSSRRDAAPRRVTRDRHRAISSCVSSAERRSDRKLSTCVCMISGQSSVSVRRVGTP